MPEKPQQQKSVRIIACPTCKGVGFVGSKRCHLCKSTAFISTADHSILYWGKFLDRSHITLYKTQEIVKNTLDFSLLVFGCIGAIFFFWEFILLSQTGGSVQLFWNHQSARLFIFWLSVITDTYLFYRYSNELASMRYIPKKLLETKKRQSFTLTRWQDIDKVPPSQVIDISQMYSQTAQKAVRDSYQHASQYGHFKVGPVHLLISLLSHQDIINMFVRLGVSFQGLKERINHILPQYRTPTESPLYLNQDFYKILYAAYIEAWYGNKKKVDTAELLIAMVKVSEIMREVFYDLSVDVNKIINVSQWIRFQREFTSSMGALRSKASLRPRSSMNRAMTAVATPFLDRFSTDVTASARSGYLEPCVGRKKEIEEIFRIMQGAMRRSVIMVGPPGVGKGMIVNGIAYMMVADEVPPFLRDKRLISLDVARLSSGVNGADANQRLLIILHEIARSGNIVVFIDHVSKMVGISNGGLGNLDLAEVLAQALSKHQLIAITTSQPEDYSRYIENKSSLYQELERITISEPRGNDAIQVLEAKSGPLETRYNIFFSYDAVEKSIELADRYLHDRYIPEKAIEVLEETAVRVAEEKGKDQIVTGEDVARTISEKTEIPLTEITKKEGEKLLHLEREMHQYMVDQNEAVKMVATAIRRARADMRDISRPIVNLLFLGPTGVGKTELAKTIIRVYFGGNEKEMIRLDMSEYQEQSSIHRLIGAPFSPGGGGEGYLTERVRKNPFSLVLLDEIEKAHPDILNIFLQVMDDGRLTDSSGRTIDFTNVIIIATSNASSVIIQKFVKQGRSVLEIKNALMEGELQKYFRPEFLNRFDGIIVFKPLSLNEVQDIARLMLGQVEKNLSEKGIGLKAMEGAIEELAEAGFDPQFGARPLRRVIQEKINDILAEYILAGKVGRRDTIVLDVGGKVEIIKARKL